ncbi:hypothetical protein D3C75_847480 [compost metagenome]
MLQGIGERQGELFVGREVVVTHPQPIADVDRRLPCSTGQGFEGGRYATGESDRQDRGIPGFQTFQVERISATFTHAVLGDGVVPIRSQGKREHLRGTVEDFHRGAACIRCLAAPARRQANDGAELQRAHAITARQEVRVANRRVPDSVPHAGIVTGGEGRAVVFDADRQRAGR